MGLEEITGFVVNTVSHSVSWKAVIFGVIILLTVLFLLHYFLDIMVDMWKLPLAIIIDAVDLLAYNKGYFDVIAALGAFLLFWTFSKKRTYLPKIIAVFVVAEALIGMWILPEYAFITNIFPFCTLSVLFLIKRH